MQKIVLCEAGNLLLKLRAGNGELRVMTPVNSLPEYLLPRSDSPF